MTPVATPSEVDDFLAAVRSVAQAPRIAEFSAAIPTIRLD
jgi:hypothetical protein